MDATWKELARKRGIVICDALGTRIIVDDIFSWAPTFDDFIKYLICQLEVCMSQNLSLSLKKCLFCPERIEFVGHDVCEDGNRPAQSKHELLKTWPTFQVARDVASFLGFLNFYSKYIPCFEQRVAPLRPLASLEMEQSVSNLMKEEQLAARQDMITAVLSDPCVGRFNPKKRSYLMMDASKLGYGYNLCQPNDDPASIAAMEREMARGECEFLKKVLSSCLEPVASGLARPAAEKFICIPI